MSDERKEYSVIGTVTIGTDDYRDLLEDKYNAIKERDEYSSKYWEYYRKVQTLEEQVEKLTAENQQYAKFIAANDEQDKLELWIVKSHRE